MTVQQKCPIQYAFLCHYVGVVACGIAQPGLFSWLWLLDCAFNEISEDTIKSLNRSISYWIIWYSTMKYTSVVQEWGKSCRNELWTVVCDDVLWVTMTTEHRGQEVYNVLSGLCQRVQQYQGQVSSMAHQAVGQVAEEWGEYRLFYH